MGHSVYQGGCCNIWPSRIITDNYRLQIITKRSIFAGDMYLPTGLQWIVDHFDLLV